MAGHLSSMDAEWRLFADLADLADGRVTVSIPGDDPTVGDALDALLESHPALRDEVLTSGVRAGDVGDSLVVAPDVALLRNGADLRAASGGADDLDQPLGDEDELALVPALSGG